ncbi:MAG: hypothetical protein M0P22_10685, partial [Methanoculleus sp.]|nr:hypothetical protein [Methanoculleus sp.]
MDPPQYPEFGEVVNQKKPTVAARGEESGTIAGGGRYPPTSRSPPYAEGYARKDRPLAGIGILHTSYFILHTSYFILHTSYFILHT